MLFATAVYSCIIGISRQQYFYHMEYTVKKLLLILIMLGSISLLAAQAKISRVFFVNLYNEPVDVRLGDEDDYIFLMEDLNPNVTTYLVESKLPGEYQLWYKLPSDEEWFYWSDPEGYPYTCLVENDKAYCISMDVNGWINFTTLDIESRGGSKVCFFNGTGSKLSSMQVGRNWGNADQEALDLEPYAMTNFLAVTPGKKSLYWQFPDQVASSRYYYYPDTTGKAAEIFDFKIDNYYLFLAFTDESIDKMILYNITP
jgi:hypothetical protein